MIVVLRFIRAPFDAVRKIRRGIRGRVGAEKIERRTKPEVQIFLHRRQIDRSRLAHRLRIVGTDLFHDFERASHDAADARIADEHVMGLFGQHELAGPRERIETRLRQRFELKLPIAIREVREHEEAQPIRDRFVERAQDARMIDASRVTREQLFGFFAAVAPEIAVQ